MVNTNLDELSLSDILENAVKSYDKVLVSHEEILTAKAELMEDQLALLRKQIQMVSEDLEAIADTLFDSRLHEICHRLRNIVIPPSARNRRSKVSNTQCRPESMVAPPSPRIAEIKRSSSESNHLSAINVRKKSITMERLEERQLRSRNSLCQVGGKVSALLDYQLSPDLLAMHQVTLAKKYGNSPAVIKAATTIQRAWRKYCLDKTFTRIKLETPNRTKSMTCRTKPIINITQDSSISEKPNTIREVDLESPLFQFKRNDITRQIFRTKGAQMRTSNSDFTLSQGSRKGSSVSLSEVRLEFDDEGTSGGGRESAYLYTQTSEPASFKVPAASKRRNTDAHDPFRPHSNSWSSCVTPTDKSSTGDRSSLLGERVSGDGAECPDVPNKESPNRMYTSAAAEKYASLWNSSSLEPDKKQLCRNYKLGVHKFNKRPSQGIKHLTSTGVVGNTPYDIAAFLLTGKGLSLAQIGNFITDLRKQLSMDVLDEFMKQINFKDLPFDQGLRHFISKLRLPGEAQKIDKLMEAFAERYCQCNPNVISDTQDTIYVLAFSVIILQTDLHNPQIKLHRKMDLESFVNNNRGIDNGKDLPRDLLEDIYEGVRKEPIISGRDHLDFLESIDKSIIGKKMTLMDPWRMLMLSTKMQELVNRNEKAPPEKHVRHVFLFNDMIVITKITQVRGKATTKSKERVISTSSFQYRQHHRVGTFKAESFSAQFHQYGVRLLDIFDENKVLLELSAYSEDDRQYFLNELSEVTWVYRALENERIEGLGVSDKLGSSTLSLHSFNSDTDSRRHTHTLGRRFFKSSIFKPQRREHLGPSSSLFYTKGISSSDSAVRTIGKEDLHDDIATE